MTSAGLTVLYARASGTKSMLELHIWKEGRCADCPVHDIAILSFERLKPAARRI
jgi:hypothetical protein